MTKLTASIALGLLLAAGSTAAQPRAASPEGDWSASGGDGIVRIAPCPGQPATLCGKFVKVRTAGAKDANNPNAALRSRPLAGMTFLTGFKPAGPGRWAGGKIYNPEDGKTYKAKLSLNPNGTLKVEGCVAVFCKAQTWPRAS